MAFQKGISGNSNGRKPGALNKKTIAHQNRAQELLDEIVRQSDVKEMVGAMTPKERASLYVNLLEYTQPRLARQEHTDGEGGPLVIKVLHSPAPVIIPTSATIEDADYIEIKSLPKTGAKPF